MVDDRLAEKEQWVTQKGIGWAGSACGYLEWTYTKFDETSWESRWHCKQASHRGCSFTYYWISEQINVNNNIIIIIADLGFSKERKEKGHSMIRSPIPYTCYIDFGKYIYIYFLRMQMLVHWMLVIGICNFILQHVIELMNGIMVMGTNVRKYKVMIDCYCKWYWRVMLVGWGVLYHAHFNRHQCAKRTLIFLHVILVSTFVPSFVHHVVHKVPVLCQSCSWSRHPVLL